MTEGEFVVPTSAYSNPKSLLLALLRKPFATETAHLLDLLGKSGAVTGGEKKSFKSFFSKVSVRSVAVMHSLMQEVNDLFFHAWGVTIFRSFAAKRRTEPACYFIESEGFLVIEYPLEFGEVVGEFLHLRAEFIEDLGRGFLAQFVCDLMCLVNSLHGILDVLGDHIPVGHGMLLSGIEPFHFYNSTMYR